MKKSKGCLGYNSALMRNLRKLQKTLTRFSQDSRAWPSGTKTALFEILQNKEHFDQF